MKGMNDTAGPNGLVPTLLVFGVMPIIPIIPGNYPSQVERMHALKRARKEMGVHIANARLRKGLSSNVPASASSEIQNGSLVLWYREKPLDKWVGPYSVLDVQKNIVLLDVNGTLTQVSIDKVKMYVQEDSATNETVEVD